MSIKDKRELRFFTATDGTWFSKLGDEPAVGPHSTRDDAIFYYMASVDQHESARPRRVHTSFLPSSILCETTS